MRIAMEEQGNDSQLREFAFDVRMAAVVRIRARRVSDALALMQDINCLDLFCVELPYSGATLTEASVRSDFATPVLFEIDGVPTE